MGVINTVIHPMIEITSINDFPHSQIIAQTKINIPDLDHDIRTTLTDFNKRYTFWSIKKNDQAKLETLLSLSNILSQSIYDYYVDKDNQEVEIKNSEPISKKEVKVIVEDIKEEKKIEDTPPVSVTKEEITPPAAAASPAADPLPPAAPIETEPTNKNEKALYNILKQKAENITIADLRAAGFDTNPLGPLGIRGCKVGKYKLHKEFSDHVFKLEKI